MDRATTSYWDKLAKERLYWDRSEEELQGMDPVEVALAPYRADSCGSFDGDRIRTNRIKQILFPPQVIRHDADDHPRRRRSSPSPPRNNNKRACIPASTNAILDLKEVVPSTAIMDGDGCAICFKALTAGQVVKDDDATASADDDLKALAALVADHEKEDDDNDDDVVVDDEKKEADDDDDVVDDVMVVEDDNDDAATVTWLRPLRLRVMPCSHVLHQHCIYQWLTRNAGCPLCGHKLPTTDHGDDDNEEEDDFWFPSVPDVDEGSWEEENEGGMKSSSDSSEYSIGRSGKSSSHSSEYPMGLPGKSSSEGSEDSMLRTGKRRTKMVTCRLSKEFVEEFTQTPSYPALRQQYQLATISEVRLLVRLLNMRLCVRSTPTGKASVTSRGTLSTRRRSPTTKKVHDGNVEYNYLQE